MSDLTAKRQAVYDEIKRVIAAQKDPLWKKPALVTKRTLARAAQTILTAKEATPGIPPTPEEAKVFDARNAITSASGHFNFGLTHNNKNFYSLYWSNN